MSFVKFAFITLAGVFVPAALYAQAPNLQWLGVSGTLFALDEQTNIYVNSSGPIVKLTVSGSVMQSNTICPVVGRTQRDAAGNYYFAGTFSPPVDFGGVTLTSGYIFAAKYDAAGVLQWARTLGPGFASGIGVGDLRVEPAGVTYVGYSYCLGSSCSSSYNVVDRLDSAGSKTWTTDYGGGIYSSHHTIRLGIATPSNVCVLVFDGGPFFRRIMGFKRAGEGSTNYSSSSQPELSQSYRAARPIRNSLGELYSVEASLLTKRSPAGAVIWTTDVGNEASWTVCEDKYDGVHVADNTGQLCRYDSDGNLVWTINTASPVEEMLTDSGGNRFFSTFSRTVGHLGPETVSAPNIDVPPQGQTVFSGSNLVLSVSATGSGPLRYYWDRDGMFVANGTNNALSLPNATSLQSGTYTVVVSNFVNSVTSSPAMVRIKSVQFFIGSQMLTNGTYQFLNPPTLSVLSAFANGSIFYTTDGSPPTFAATPYTGPITVSTNATLRALGYSADFLQSEEADPVNIIFPPKYGLAASAIGPGSIALNPPGGLYQTGTVVNATATPSGGWTFLYWAGDAGGATPSVNIAMDQNKSIQAVFGTTLATTATGGGQVQKYPPGGIYPYGTVVRLMAIPDSGKYFGVWGNASSGSANPLYFTLTNPGPTVSSLFATVPAGQAALTVLITGPGSVNVNPPGNLFDTNQTISVTATPFAGQGFTSWSGDTGGTDNPLSVPMTQSRVITANFTNWPVLIASGHSVTPQGFQFRLISGPGLAYEVQSSTNLKFWTHLGIVTNDTGNTEIKDPAGANLPFRFYKATPKP